VRKKVEKTGKCKGKNEEKCIWTDGRTDVRNGVPIRPRREQHTS